MQIAFSKVGALAHEFSQDFENVKFSGKLERKDARTLSCEGQLKGYAETICARCGEELEAEISQPVQLLLSDGEFKDAEGELSDAMEFFGGYVDLCEVAASELELFLSDYFYCENCKNGEVGGCVADGCGGDVDSAADSQPGER